MTKSIPMKPNHNPGARPISTSSQRRTEKSMTPVKKAPAPPPNPALMNLQTSAPEVKPAVQQDVNQADANQNFSPHPSPAEAGLPMPSQESSNSYDKHTEGALTYFSYYFEDIVSPTTPLEPFESPRSKIPAGVVGVGVVAATIASGLVIGDALKPPQVPQNKSSQDSANKQNTNSQQSRPSTISPEKLETGRSLSSTPGWSTPNKPSPSKQTAPALKRTQSTADSLVSRGPLVSNSPPLKLQPLSVSSIPASVPIAPEAPSSSRAMPNSRRNSIPSAIAESATNLPAVAPSETPPSTESAPAPFTTSPTPPANRSTSPSTPQGTEASQLGSQSPTPVSSQPAQSPLSGTASSGKSTPFPPGSTAPVPAPDSTNFSQTAYTPTSPQPGNSEATGNSRSSVSTTPATNSIAPAAANRQPTAGQPVMAPGDRLLETNPSALNRVTPASGSPAASSASGSSVVAVGSSEGIQDYLNRPQKPGNPALALMPLSSRAAVEAAGKPQIGSFTVRQVNQQEYQKEWLTSNRNPSDPAIASAFPAYGFIDYQRQVIIVLKEHPDTNPLQSRLPNGPSS